MKISGNLKPIWRWISVGWLCVAGWGIMPASAQETLPQADPVKADSLVQFARQFIATPYVWGGCSPSGFDCSGFVHFVFARFGYKIERSSSGLARLGIPIPPDSAAKGDILLFRGTNPRDPSVGHVGIVVSAPGEELAFIHASSSPKHPGVVITEYHRSGYPARFIAARRILHALP